MAYQLRFLVVEGNKREARESHRASFGLSPSDSYARILQSIEPGALCDIALPADEGANLPDSAGLSSYDGVFLTGSALNIYQIEPAVTRQLDLMRAVYAAGVPAFGSCWGLQVGAVAASGHVHRNPRGREIGFARRIAPTEEGLGHPLLAGRPRAFDAPAVHVDEVVVVPDATAILASNAMSPVQAAEIRCDGGSLWGVQYHPEFSLKELAVIMRRQAGLLVADGYARTIAEALETVDAIERLHDEPARGDLAWKLGLDTETLDESRRLTEIRNFIAYRVKAEASRRGRA